MNDLSLKPNRLRLNHRRLKVQIAKLSVSDPKQFAKGPQARSGSRNSLSSARRVPRDRFVFMAHGGETRNLIPPC